MNLTQVFSTLNEFVYPRQLRKYQAVIADGGAVELDGIIFKFLASWMARNGQIIYICSYGELAIGIITHRVREGYPIVLCVDYSSGERIWSDGKRSTESLSTILNTEIEVRRKEINSCTKSCELNIKPVLLVGHRNFAHFIWNQLGAIIKLSNSGHGANFDYCEISSPLGNLEDILQKSNGETLRKVLNIRLRKIQSGIIMFRAGGARVDVGSIDSVYGLARRWMFSTSGPLERYINFSKASEGKVKIWISVRHDKRTCINFNDFFEGLVKPEIMSISKKVAIVFDGFSTQHDYAGDNLGFIERLNENHQTINSLTASCEKQGIMAINLNGCSLYESIVYARDMNVYISHVGTLQHKVGWFSIAEGIVHMPPSRKWERQAKWLTHMVEGGRTPKVLETSDNKSTIDAVVPSKDANYIIEINEANKTLIRDVIQNAQNDCDAVTIP
jgi:hypothetical protein